MMVLRGRGEQGVPLVLVSRRLGVELMCEYKVPPYALMPDTDEQQAGSKLDPYQLKII